MASTRNILDCHDDHVGTATSAQPDNLPKVSNIRTRKKKVELVGSSPSFVYDKFTLEEVTGPPQANDDQSSSGVENQLASQNVCNEKEILNIINDFSEKKPCQVWLSNCLPRHLGLPMTSRPPSPQMLQVFVLCVGKPPFVATISNEGLDPDGFEEYCKNTARIIHWCLLDFCHLQFVLLPVCIKGSEFNKETLNSRLEECVEVVGRFFRKQIPLSETMFQKLTTAANAMTGATFVPSLLESSDPENLWILIMPRDWQTELFRMLQFLDRKGAFDVNVPSNELPDSAQMIVVLEAAFRMCFTEDVLITSNSDALESCVELFQALHKDVHGIELNLSHQLVPSGGLNDDEVSLKVEVTTDYQRLLQNMYQHLVNGKLLRLTNHQSFTCRSFFKDLVESCLDILSCEVREGYKLCEGRLSVSFLCVLLVPLHDIHSSTELRDVLADAACDVRGKTTLRLPYPEFPALTGVRTSAEELQIHHLKDGTIQCLGSADLHVPSTLLTASAEGSALSLQLSRGEDWYLALRMLTDTSIIQTDKDGNTVLHLAIKAKQLDALKLVLKLQFRLAKRPFRQKSVRSNVPSVKHPLGQMSVRPNVPSVKCPSGQTSVGRKSVRPTRRNVRRQNVHRPNIRSRDKDATCLANNAGNIPLHLACEAGDPTVAKHLIKHLCALNMEKEVNQPNRAGRSPLHIACSIGRASLVKLLLNHNANVNAEDSSGRTPLHLACLAGHTDVAIALLHSSDQSSINKADKDGLTALHHACSSGSSDIVRLLLQYSADVHISKNNSALSSAMKYSGINSKRLQIVRLLLAHDPDTSSLKLDRLSDILSEGYGRVSEQERRVLFKEAVEHRKWNVVTKYADHNLYDDQRVWAIEQAYKDKQWQIMLLLADYGLSEIVRMSVYQRLSKYADWEVVLEMLERVDISEVKKIIENAMLGKKTEGGLHERWKKVVELEMKIATEAKQSSFVNYVNPTRLTKERRRRSLQHDDEADGRWRRKIFNMFQNRSGIRYCDFQAALTTAIRKKAWHIVMQLIKFEKAKGMLDSLFIFMIKQHQWGVCRALLHQVVSEDAAVIALPKFMEMNQWALVAMLMDYNVGDTLRREVMNQAFEKGEGSVVWQCISTLEHDHLSEQERKELFQKARSRGLWQAIKPLIEMKDTTGIKHRDTALLAAIKERQWDVVDHCLLHKADIDLLDKNGETSLDKAVRNMDWNMVKELLDRGADVTHQDKDGCSLLHRAIASKQWEVVKMAIELLANLHQPVQRDSLDFTKGLTPLQMLIDARQGEIIDHTLVWSPGQSGVVNDQGETTLHAVVLGKNPQLLYFQVIRGVDPLRTTNTGQTVLLYAVCNELCPQRMVAECIRLGFSTHQPRLTKLGSLIEDVVLGVRSSLMYRITSPLLMAILLDLPTVAYMLYESGACSLRELYWLYIQLGKIVQKYEITMEASGAKTYRFERVLAVQKFLPHLENMATNPRRLESSCRLAISLCFIVRGRRQRIVNGQMDLPELVRNFITFSDLLDPDYAGPPDISELMKNSVIPVT